MSSSKRDSFTFPFEWVPALFPSWKSFTMASPSDSCCCRWKIFAAISQQFLPSRGQSSQVPVPSQVEPARHLRSSTSSSSPAVPQSGFSREEEPLASVYVQEEICCKELARAVMEATRPDLQGGPAGWRPRRASDLEDVLGQFTGEFALTREKVRLFCSIQAFG